jgi:hypothetical protein
VSAEVATEPTVENDESASVRRVARDQRKTVLVALGLAVASYWVIGQLGEWGLANHLATELWLLRIITSGAQPSRSQMVRATVVRLAVLTLVAVGLTVWLWPDGVGLLLGLAVFRLLALMMTSIALLKELKSQ